MGYPVARLAVSVLCVVTAAFMAATGALSGGDVAGRGARRFTPVSAEPWSRLADCESGDPGVPGSARWGANTGNGYFGGLQFSRSSWAEVGGVGEPHRAPRHQQVEMARRLHQRQGFSAWPACARRLGLIAPAGGSQ